MLDSWRKKNSDSTWIYLRDDFTQCAPVGSALKAPSATRVWQWLGTSYTNDRCRRHSCHIDQFNLHSIRVTCQPLNTIITFLHSTENWPECPDVFFSPSRPSHQKYRIIWLARETSVFCEGVIHTYYCLFLLGSYASHTLVYGIF